MKKLLISAYLIAGIIAFGHAWNRDYSNCVVPAEARFYSAIAAGAFWPLYVSTLFFQPPHLR